MKTRFVTGVFLLASIFQTSATIRLSGVFGDNMVIQRDVPIKVWGWGDKGEKVTVRFNGQKENTKVGRDGYWKVALKEMPFGGPYDMTVSGGDNTIELSNILIGEVWFCSGQSNMEFQVKLSDNAAKEIETADYPMIRSLNVPRTVRSTPQEDINGRWEVCSPSTVGNFTAVGYYYARELYKRLHIPIGIIHSSWGATGVRTWTSRPAFDTLPFEMKTDYDRLALQDYERFEQLNTENRKRFEEALKDDIGMREKWYESTTDISSWDEIRVPCAWVSTPLGYTVGNVWYCYKLQLTERAAGKPAVLSLGVIDDGDVVWVNGIKVGEGSGYDKRRIYDVPKDVLKNGENTITIKVNNAAQTGGFISEPENYYLAIKGGGNLRYGLSGTWKYKKSAASIDYDYVEIGPNIAPSLLYNAMVHPFIKFKIRGVIWYQGEHDRIRAHAYRTMFPNLINDWRHQWGYEYPFFWVSLANMNIEDSVPKDSPWAELREAQTMTLSLPQTGQAVIYDIGDAYNIHPGNKQEVGRRLSLLAMNKVYGEKALVCEGPTYKSFEKKGDKIIVTFEGAEGGL